ncbi:MAG: DUF1295 domain-containing protein [Planctomycetota bacterium]
MAPNESPSADSGAATKTGWARGILVSAVATAVGVAVGWAGGQGGAVLFGLPLMVVAAGVAFVVQWIAFVPSYLRQTEHYYDLTGSLTYQMLTWGTLIAAGTFAPRQGLLAAMVVVWSGRLGLFLFRRVKRAGKDGRFDAIKPDGGGFLIFWSIQGLWVVLTMATVLSVVALPASAPLGILDGVGAAVWLFGFAIEVIADRQKSAFKADPANRGRFIDVGLWSWSRHPNYFGEIVLWVGVALIAFSDLEGWRLVTMISPVFVFLLITFVSGVPLLEARADERWGNNDAYQAYKARTAMLIPRPPR